MKNSFVLVASCPDRMGITRAVSNFIYSQGASISQSDQHGEQDTERFFMRTEFFGTTAHSMGSLDQLRSGFEPIAAEFDMDWQLHDCAIRPKVLVAVSRSGHCLNDLLFRWRNGDLPADIVGVVSNHEDLREKVEWYGLPYHFLPVSNDNRPQQEQQILQIIEQQQVDLLVLARYMQILSTPMCEQLERRAINIHHSFLPSFKGARPYQQAYERGVKIIGATAHYVTSDLDEGPIIEQDVQRIAHSVSSKEIVRVGSDVESRVLRTAVRWHCEHRVLLNNSKTVVFN